MELKAGLWQQQTLKITMTQELSQAIALLQYSAVELVAFLENKALENPLLQIDNIKNDPTYRIRKKGIGQNQKDKAWIEQIGDQRFSLADYIQPQLQDLNLTTKQKQVIKHYIDYLDDNGYFTGDLTELANHFQLTMEEAENCLAILQQLEPVGIGARNLQECLLLQIRIDPKGNELAETLVSNHFTMLAERKWKALAKILSTEINEIQKAFDYIANLNPKPGSAFHYERASYVVPDVMIVKDGDQFVVQLFDNILPKVQFNKDYFKNLSGFQDRSLSEYLHEKRQDFHWIVRSLEQRQRTIINVTGKILEKQPQYFEKGPNYLKPMTMKEISDELGIHESTVSRTVREKYVQTPFGTVELKSFFTNAIESLSDEALSSSKVRDAMVKLINHENKLSPLSDLDMVKLLKDQEGIVVSRRTLAKYREQLGIPSSSKRKRYE